MVRKRMFTTESHSKENRVPLISFGGYTEIPKTTVHCILMKILEK